MNTIQFFIPTIKDMKNIILRKSKKAGKKYRVSIPDFEGKRKTLYFGKNGCPDFTFHHDEKKKSYYINRHKSKENWELSGIYTAGFWSRWLLFNRISINESVKDIQQRFGITITINI